MKLLMIASEAGLPYFIDLRHFQPAQTHLVADVKAFSAEISNSGPPSQDLGLGIGLNCNIFSEHYFVH